MSSRHGRRRGKKTQEPTRWSEWEWTDEHNCWARYRVNAYGDYEWKYRYDESKNTDEAERSSTSYSVPHISVEDSNPEQYEGSDARAGRERGHEKSRGDLSPERFREESPREPSVSPTRPISPGPPDAPFPTDEYSSSSYPSSSYPSSSYPSTSYPSTSYPSSSYPSSSYPSSAGYAAGYYGVSPTSPTSSTSSAYPTAPTEQYGVARAGEYNERSHEPSNMQDYSQEETLLTIKSWTVRATLSSSKESLISADMVESLGLKKESIKSRWPWTNPDSGKRYEIKERVRTDIEMTGRTKLRDVKLYVTPKKISLKNPVILGTDLMGIPNAAAQDYLSSKSSDSGYATANSRRPSFNLPLRPMDSAFTPVSSSATYADRQPSYSSVPPSHHPSMYAQNLSSVQEAPTSSHTASSYPMEEGGAMSGPRDSVISHSSHHDTYYVSSTSSRDQNQDSGFSSYDSGAQSGTTGASGSGEEGMENYTLHSDSHTGQSPYLTPRPAPPSDESQNVYTSAPDDAAYTDYVTH